MGVAVYFFIRKEEAEGFKIFYNEIDDYVKAEAKQKYLSENTIKSLSFDHIRPSKRNNWLKLADNNFEDLIPLIDKDVKKGKSEKAIFKLFSRGVETTRDDWVYDVDRDHLKEKVQFFINIYNQNLEEEEIDTTIKWSSSLKNYKDSGREIDFDEGFFGEVLYRPFHKVYHYQEKLMNHRLTNNHYQFAGEDLDRSNLYINFCTSGSNKNFYLLGSNILADLHLTGDTQCISLYRYPHESTKVDNITDWGLEQFREHYGDSEIRKKDIFHYVYAVLNNPAYGEKYKLNLKRDFPRIPFHDNFGQWVEWGHELMELHLNYEEVEPYDLELVHSEFDLDRAPKTKLKADHENGTLQLDEKSALHGIPDDAWRYELGNRTALEWICYYRKERKSRDDTIQEHFNDYDFQDYKEEVIDLLKRVCTVSVKTVAIQDQMRVITTD